MSQFTSLKDAELGWTVISGINVTTYKSKVRELGLKAKTWLPDKFQNSNRYYFGEYDLLYVVCYLKE